MALRNPSEGRMRRNGLPDETRKPGRYRPPLPDVSRCVPAGSRNVPSSFSTSRRRRVITRKISQSGPDGKRSYVVGWNPKWIGVVADVVKIIGAVTDVHHQQMIENASSAAEWSIVRVAAGRWCPQRLAHRQRKHRKSGRERNGGHNHDAACEGADSDAEEKRSAQTNRVGE